MDPDACLAKLLDAFRDGSRKHARFALEDLLGWITRGGALPQDPRVFTEQEAEISDRLLAAINDLMPMLQKLRGEPDTSDIPEADEAWFKRARLITPHVMPSSRERAVAMVAEAAAAMVLAATDEEIMAAAAANHEDLDLLITRVQATIEKNTPDQG